MKLFRRIMNKLLGTRGESMVESLIALLLVALSSAMLVQSVRSSVNINQFLIESDDKYEESLDSAFHREDSTGSAVVNAGGKEVKVNLFGDDELVSFYGENHESPIVYPTDDPGKKDPQPTDYPEYSPDIKEYTVTFNANGHGTAPAPQTVKAGGKATEPAAPSATGYRFGGWYRDTSLKNRWDFSSEVTENMILYAKWSKICTVNWSGNGGTAGESSRTVAYGDPVGTLPGATRKNYTFTGWYTTSDGDVAITANTIVFSDVTYYAHWVKSYNCTVYYYVDGQLYFTGYENKGENIKTMPTQPTKKGYTFTGWYTSSSGGSEWDFEEDTLSGSSLNLYARFKENEHEIVGVCYLKRPVLSLYYTWEYVAYVDGVKYSDGATARATSSNRRFTVGKQTFIMPAIEFGSGSSKAKYYYFTAGTAGEWTVSYSGGTKRMENIGTLLTSANSVSGTSFTVTDGTVTYTFSLS